MCFPSIGKKGKAESFSGTFEEYQASRGDGYIGNTLEAVQRADYNKAVAAGKEETSQSEQEAEIEAAEETEAQKTAALKSEALEEQISSLSAPLSSMVARQGELGVKRKGSKGKRSLLTSGSGGLGYYSKYFS